MTEGSRNSSNEKGRPPWLGYLFTGMLLTLPAYVLSTGPAVWLRAHGYLPEQAGYIYFPLGILADRCQPIGDAFEWYLAFWQ